MRRTSWSKTDWVALVVVAAAVLWGLWSYVQDGVVYALIAAARGEADGLALIRASVERVGPMGPVVYVAAVVVEVMVAPIPGTLLYAPGGAIFGGALGGTLSLLGNVMGAAAASWIAATFGHRFIRMEEQKRFPRLRQKLEDRGLLVIALLRVNPLTSSDLVSYVAGLVGVPVWRVAVGTLVGMAPLCYAQAYASDWIFSVIPNSALVVLVLGAAYLVVVLWIAAQSLSRPRDGQPLGD